MNRDGGERSGDPDSVGYFRRRSLELADDRVKRVERKVDELDHKVDALSLKVAVIAAILSTVTIAANIIGPVIAARILGIPQ